MLTAMQYKMLSVKIRRSLRGKVAEDTAWGILRLPGRHIVIAPRAPEKFHHSTKIAQAGLTGGLFFTILVDQLFEFFARFEIRHAFGRNVDGIARFRITSAPCIALSHTK